MEGFFRRYRNALVLIAVILAQTIALATQVKRVDYGGRSDGAHVRLLRIWEETVLSIPEMAFSRFGHGIRNLWHGYIDLRHLHQQNDELQKQLGQIRLQEAALAEDAREDARLRTLLNFRRQYIAKTVVAQVIGTSGIDSSHVVMLDKGSDDGLKPDMPVITPDGIAGKLRNVTTHTSELLLINDASSGAGVVFEAARIRAVLHGTPNGITEITNLLPDTRIKPGDRLLTSGGDQVYPRGLNVGVVKSAGLDPDHPPYALIVIQPAVKLAQLEEVLIITDVAFQQSNEANAAEDALSTSQVLGERLPGLHDPHAKADETTQPPPATTVMAPAHAAPPAHADRYSPGTTPPATSLTPGGSHDGDSQPQTQPQPQTQE